MHASRVLEGSCLNAEAEANCSVRMQALQGSSFPEGHIPASAHRDSAAGTAALFLSDGSGPRSSLTCVTDAKPA